MFETEKKLVEACRAGDKKAQEALYNKYKHLMLGLTSRYADSKMQAEDLLLEGFTKVFKDIGQFAFKQDLKYWIRRIMINTCLMTLRKKGHLKFDDLGQYAINGHSVDPVILDQLSTDFILDTIQKLPAGFRIVFNLYAIEGFSHKEIAEQLKIKEGTSRSQYLRARKLLQRHLSSEFIYQ